MLEGHPKDITSVAFLPDSKTLVSADKDSTLKLWDTATGKEIRSIRNEDQQLDGIPVLTASPDGKQIIAWLALAEIGTYSSGRWQATRCARSAANICRASA